MDALRVLARIHGYEAAQRVDPWSWTIILYANDRPAMFFMANQQHEAIALATKVLAP